MTAPAEIVIHFHAAKHVWIARILARYIQEVNPITMITMPTVAAEASPQDNYRGYVVARNLANTISRNSDGIDNMAR